MGLRLFTDGEQKITWALYRQLLGLETNIPSIGQATTRASLLLASFFGLCKRRSLHHHVYEFSSVELKNNINF